MGLISDGGVHSQLAHMIEAVRIIAAAGVPVVVHAITDGRDVAPKSAGGYLAELVAALPTAARIGTISDVPIALEWNSTTAWGTSESSSTQIQGSDPIVITSAISPVGSIDLTTLVNATGASADATVQITDSTGDTASIFSSAFSPIAPNAAVSQFALSQTASGGAFVALNTNGDTGLAASYATIFDDTGFLFFGTGEATNTAIATSVSDRTTYTGHSMFLSAGFPISDRWTIRPKFGPMYRNFSRSKTTATTIDIDEGFSAAPSIPNINLAETTTLDSSYFGAIFGTTVSSEFHDKWLISLGADVGLAGFNTSTNNFSTVSIAGASSTIPEGSMKATGTSRIGRLSAGLTHIRPNGAIINLNAFVDYMSDVPYVQTTTVAQPAVVDNGTDVGLVGTGQTYRVHSIRQKEIFSSGFDFGIVFLF